MVSKKLEQRLTDCWQAEYCSLPSWLSEAERQRLADRAMELERQMLTTRFHTQIGRPSRIVQKRKHIVEIPNNSVELIALANTKAESIYEHTYPRWRASRIRRFVFVVLTNVPAKSTDASYVCDEKLGVTRAEEMMGLIDFHKNLTKMANREPDNYTYAVEFAKTLEAKWLEKEGAK